MKSVFGKELPRRQRKGDAGYDFYLPEDVEFRETFPTEIDTGIIMEEGDIPDGYVMLLFPRSSLGTEYGLEFANSVGVIDSGYRGTIKAKMNVRYPMKRDGVSVPLVLLEGTRFMQGVIVPFATIPNEMPPAEERDGGIGSTGQ